MKADVLPFRYYEMLLICRYFFYNLDLEILFNIAITFRGVRGDLYWEIWDKKFETDVLFQIINMWKCQVVSYLISLSIYIYNVP
jgi:hypothetical protein